MLSHSHKIVRTLVVSAAVVVYMAIGVAAPVLAQQAYAPDSLSAADYDRAEGFPAIMFKGCNIHVKDTLDKLCTLKHAVEALFQFWGCRRHG